MATLTRKERLRRQALGQEVDRIPTIGGWMNGPRVIAELGGMTLEAYLADPLQGVVQANVALDIDGMVGPNVPDRADQIRSGSVTEANYAGREPEELVAAANAIPDSEREILAGFDAREAERRYRDHFERAFRDWRGLEPIPNFWEIGGPFPLYHQYGYEAFLMACALYPEAVGKIWWSRCIVARERAKLLVPLYAEYDLVPLMFCGEDLCNNQGPMVSLDLLRRHYFPHVARIIEPLIDAGVRLIHHCDGDVRPVLGDFFAMGFSGLQGFQYELGMDLRDLKTRAAASGVDPLFFAGMSVSRTLPFGTAEEVRAEIDYFFDATDGGRGMYLLTSNVTGVEVPPANIRTAYTYAQTLVPGAIDRPHYAAWPGRP